jgi:hypothetical protein
MSMNLIDPELLRPDYLKLTWAPGEVSTASIPVFKNGWQLEHIALRHNGWYDAYYKPAK